MRRIAAGRAGLGPAPGGVRSFAAAPLDWRPYGRPKAKAVALAHEQAALDAQDHAARHPRVPAVPFGEAAAPRLPDLRLLRGPRGRSAVARRIRRVAEVAMPAFRQARERSGGRPGSGGPGRGPSA